MGRQRYGIGVAIICVALIVYKFRFLSLPYYWDEAWPYSKAVLTMYNHGLSFLPRAIPSEVSRGHPLMFFLMAASWMKLFGPGLFSGHCFALFISILLLVSIFLFCKAVFTPRIGFIACMLFASQATFITQSVFLLPEVLMALWTILCFYAYFKNKIIIFIICSSAMLLTKESACVLIITLGFYELLEFSLSRDRQINALVKKAVILIVPVAIAFLYFVVQKIQYGWFLFPFHTQYLSSQWTSFLSNLPNCAAYFLFIMAEMV